jgi:hypothetical protein
MKIVLSNKPGNTCCVCKLVLLKIQNVNIAQRESVQDFTLKYFIEHDISLVNVNTFIAHMFYDVAVWLADKSPGEAT